VCVVTTVRLSDLVTGKQRLHYFPKKLCGQGNMEGQAGISDHLNLLRRLGFTHTRWESKESSFVHSMASGHCM
jgi:hypothetical protein